MSATPPNVCKGDGCAKDDLAVVPRIKTYCHCELDCCRLRFSTDPDSGRSLCSRIDIWSIPASRTRRTATRTRVHANHNLCSDPFHIFRRQRSDQDQIGSSCCVGSLPLFAILWQLVQYWQAGPDARLLVQLDHTGGLRATVNMSNPSR